MVATFDTIGQFAAVALPFLIALLVAERCRSWTDVPVAIVVAVAGNAVVSTFVNSVLPFISMLLATPPAYWPFWSIVATQFRGLWNFWTGQSGGWFVVTLEIAKQALTVVIVYDFLAILRRRIAERS
jgi:hypothetical protein